MIEPTIGSAGSELLLSLVYTFEYTDQAALVLRFDKRLPDLGGVCSVVT